MSKPKQIKAPDETKPAAGNVITPPAYPYSRELAIEVTNEIDFKLTKAEETAVADLRAEGGRLAKEDSTSARAEAIAEHGRLTAAAVVAMLDGKPLPYIRTLPVIEEQRIAVKEVMRAARTEHARRVKSVCGPIVTRWLDEVERYCAELDGSKSGRFSKFLKVGPNAELAKRIRATAANVRHWRIDEGRMTNVAGALEGIIES